MVKVTKLPDVQKQLTETMGMTIKASSPEELGKFNSAQMDRWSKVIKENGIKAD